MTDLKKDIMDNSGVINTANKTQLVIYVDGSGEEYVTLSNLVRALGYTQYNSQNASSPLVKAVESVVGEPLTFPASRFGRSKFGNHNTMVRTLKLRDAEKVVEILSRDEKLALSRPYACRYAGQLRTQLRKELAMSESRGKTKAAEAIQESLFAEDVKEEERVEEAKRVAKTTETPDVEEIVGWAMAIADRFGISYAEALRLAEKGKVK